MAVITPESLRLSLNHISHYYGDARLPEKWTPKKGAKHWAWIEKHYQEATFISAPKVLETFAEQQKVICKNDSFLTDLKTYALATSLFMFAIGSIVGVIPLGISGIIMPIFKVAMAASVVSLVVSVATAIIRKAVLYFAVRGNSDIFGILDKDKELPQKVEITQKRVRLSLNSITHYYKNVSKSDKWTPEKGTEDWKEIEEHALQFEHAQKAYGVDPETLQAFAKQQKAICQKDSFLTDLKTYTLATSLFTFVIGCIAVVTPLGGIAGMILPIFKVSMAISIVSLVTSIATKIIGKAMLYFAVRENRVLFKTLNDQTSQLTKIQEPKAQSA